MTYDPDDTIAAIATAPGGAARGMVRLSGPRVVDCLGRCFVPQYDRPLEQIRQPIVVEGSVNVELGDGDSRSLRCDLFFWPTSRSYTRQPVAELHTLGSPPLVAALLETVCRAGARLAEPGEFTLRAFLAGRLDLTQAEAVLGVIDAHGEEELEAALAQLAGGLAQPLSQLRDDLLQLLAELEAGLDFVEENIEFIGKVELSRRLAASVAEVRRVAEQLAGRGDAAACYQMVLLGPPNVGKSSLFNALIARWGARSSDSRALSALVSAEKGTTRDYLVAELDLNGLRCQLVDTAGIAEEACNAADEQLLPAAAAQSMTQVNRRRAQLRLWCYDATVGDGGMPSNSEGVVVITKADLRPSRFVQGDAAIVTSSVTGEGLDRLAATIRAALVQSHRNGGSCGVAATAARCRESLRLAEDALVQAGEIAASGGGDELVAGEVRLALVELGKVVGAVYTDDVLDRIFSGFCIGK